MTRRLILMRHAKSSWNNRQRDDHARPLNDRGQRSAKTLGNWLRSQGYLPDRILCSSAQRTRETCAGLDLDAPTRFLDDLYHAGADRMLQILRRASEGCVLMLGHNPGIAMLAHELVADPPDHARFDDYPTGATLVVDFPADDWAEARAGTGRVVDFIVPRELDDSQGQDR